MKSLHLAFLGILLFAPMASAQSPATGQQKVIIIKKPKPPAAVQEKAAPAPAKNSKYRGAFPTDAPEISRGVGQEGGVVLFWPRVIPRSEAADKQPLAFMLQLRMKNLLKEALPGRPVDVRPEPERVCPRSGCAGMTVGVLLHPHGKSCMAVAVISGAGKGPAILLPWAGEVNLKKATIPFRAAPESQVQVTDYTKCDEMLAERKMKDREADIIKAIRAAAALPPR